MEHPPLANDSITFFTIPHGQKFAHPTELIFDFSQLDSESPKTGGRIAYFNNMGPGPIYSPLGERSLALFRLQSNQD